MGILSGSTGPRRCLSSWPRRLSGAQEAEDCAEQKGTGTHDSAEHTATSQTSAVYVMTGGCRAKAWLDRVLHNGHVYTPDLGLL